MSPLFHSELNNNNNRLDLYELVTHNPTSTFFARYVGEDLPDFTIFNQDILLIDRSVKPTTNKTVVVTSDGEFKIEKFIDINKKPVEVWGVITYVIHKK